MIHPSPVSSAFSDRDSMLPQDTVSSGRPRPIKLSVDSDTMAPRTFMTTMNSIDGRKLGSRWFQRMWKNPPPVLRATATYSLRRSRRTSVRTTRATAIQPVAPSTSDSVHGSFAPSAA